MKTCRTCKEDKDDSLFYKNPGNTTDGLFPDCIECIKKRPKKKYPYTEDMKIRAREYYRKNRNNLEFLEKKRAADRKWYRKHREQKIASVQEYRRKKKEEYGD